MSTKLAWGLKHWGFASDCDHLIGISTHAPQYPMVTYTRMGTDSDEVVGEFCDLPIRRDEGRVVDTPLVFKRGSFWRRKGETEKEKEGDGKREKKSRGERGARLVWRKGLSPRLEWKDDERRWR
ncbi:hypothetical protein TNCV_4517761 [Trichonephila clavipes]|nr:hypothetical protein TNCV_4517761 [Trichonephila clavipes]